MSEASEPTPAPAPRRTMPAPRLVAIVAILASVVVVLAAAGTAPWWAPVLPWAPAPSAPAGPTREELAALEQRIDRVAQQVPARPDLKPLEDRLAALEHRAPPAASPEALAALRGDIDAVKSDLAGLKASLAKTADLVQKLDAAAAERDHRLQRLEAESGARGDSADRVLLIAIGALRGAVEASRPYAGELAAVAALAHDQPEILARLAPLQDAAAAGLPGPGFLAQRFRDRAAPAILKAAATDLPPDASWADRAWAKVSSLVVVRRLDADRDGAAHPVQKAVADAQAALDRADIGAAIAAIETLSGAPVGAAAPWLAEAKRQRDAETQLSELSQIMAKRLAAPPPAQ
jgi:hypothetical protein